MVFLKKMSKAKPLFKRAVWLALLISISMTLLIYGDWDIEVPYNGISGKSASLDLDNNNNPHILYFVDADYFYHIYKSGGVWYGPYAIEPVNYFTNCRMIDIAMVGDTANALMSIEFADTVDYLLWGKHQGGGSWSTQQIPNTLVSSDGGGYLNVAIYPEIESFSFHIIYVFYNYGSPILYYRKYTGTWTSAEQVSSIPDVSAGWQNDIAVDANNDPHISFVYADEGVKYRKKSGGSWESVELVAGTSDPAFTSITVDNSNFPHIAYDHDGWGSIGYCFKTSGGWQPQENVGAGGGWNTYGASIAISGDEKFIAYYSSGKLRFARRTTTDWVSEDVDTVSDVGKYTSLSIDSEGYAHIAYYDETNERLKYAKSTEPVTGVKESNNSQLTIRNEQLTIYPNPFTTVVSGYWQNKRRPENG
jgi:hypothetical protein